MVITTISVVFTLPASAVTSTAFSQDFESYNVGDAPATGYTATWKVYDEGANGYFKGGMPTESGWMATTTNVANTSVVTIDDETLTTGNTGKYLYLPDWAGIGMTVDLEPNTTYTLTYKQYAKVADNAGQAREIHVYDITGLQDGFSFKSGVAAYDNTALTRLAYNRATPSPALTWNNNTYTFTTGADTTKVLVYFHTDAPNGFYLDDILITYDAVPTVKAETYGAATKNGGRAWIETDVTGATEGMSVTYKAMPYESSLFDGWYVDGVKVSSETTLTRAWATSEKVVAKFEALSENLFPDVEDRTTYNTNGAKHIGDAKYTWVSGRAVTHTLIDTNLLTAISCYGNTGALTNAYAYSGKLSFTPASTGGHRSYQIVKVKPNTAYTLSFWYYQDTTVLFSGTNSNAMIGSINLDLATNPYTAETNEPADSKIIRVTSGGNNTFTDFTNDEGVEVQKRDIGAVWSNTAVTGEWAKATATFTSDEKGWVVIPFGGGNAVYLDHFTLYETPVATTPTVTVSDNGMNAGFIQSVSDVYYEGDTFTATAVGYDNGTFLGWYVNDQKVSESLTYVFTYDSEATYVAKFDALTPNVFEDGSFEGYTASTSKLASSGQSASSTGMFVWGTWNGTTQTPTAKGWVGTQYGRGYVASASAVNEIAAGAAPYAGNNVAVGYTGSHAIGKIVPVEQNKTYKLVYYTYSLSANALASAKNGVIGVDTSYGTIANGSMTFLTDGTNGQTALTTTYTSFDAATTGTWVRQEATFNSGNYTNVLVQFGVGASQGLMIDHISVFEVPTAFAPTVTVDDGGKNAGIVYDVTEVYKDGEEFSATAKAYANGEFIGWYVGDVKVSDAETFTFTYDSTKTYTAKFSALKANIWPEDPAPSSTTALYKGTGHTTPKAIGANDWTGQSWATFYNVDNDYIATLGDGLKAYAGDTAYYFGGHNGHQAYKVVRGLKTNTDYTLGYWIYTNRLKSDGTEMADPTVNDTTANATVNYGITGIATGATMIEVDDMCVKIGAACTTYPQVRPTQSVVTKNVVANQWCYIERTFNTGANTDFLINFGNNDSTLVMYDHVALFETPVQVTPTVTVDDGGMNAGRVYGVTKVWTEGETFTATTMAYENGTFLGFYVGNEKVADDKVVANADGSYTATFTYDEDAAYTAKYSAEQKNIFPDHEDRTTFNKVGDKFVGTAAYHWVSGATVNHTVIDKDILTAVTTYGYGNSVISADKVYAGDSSFTGSTTGGHSVYQIVKVEPNTKYQLTYYYYQDSAIHKTSGIYSINLDIAQNIYADVYTNESADDLVLHTSGAGYPQAFTSEAGVHQALLASTNEGSFSEVGAWTKIVRTFTSDELGWVLVPFSTDVSGTYYVDHVSLVKVPAPMTVTVDNTKGYLTVDGAYAESAEFAAGDNATVTLNTYAGSVFQGWYEDPTFTGEAVSTDPTLNVTATEGTTLYAKFVTSNILADPGFENMSGDIEGKEDQYGWYTEVQSGHGGDTWTTITVVSESAGITPYSGNKMFRLNHRSNDGALRRLTGLKKNTVYTISFMANMENDHAEGDCFLEAVAVTDLDVLAVSRNGGNVANPYAFKPHSHKYQLAETVATHDDWGWTTPEWKRVTLTFNSGNLEEANLLITFTSEAGAMLIDEFTIQEGITSSVSVETLNPFAESTLDVVGGKAEILHLTGEGDYTYVGMGGTAAAQLKATAFNNSKFLGWYVGETKVSSEATTIVEFSQATNYVAKFAAFDFDEGTPVFVDTTYGAGFENATQSENFVVLSDTYAVPTTTVIDDTTYYIPTYEDGKTWTSSNKDKYGQIGVTKEMAFDGDYSLVIRDGAKGESVFNKITGLTADTDYSLSFWYYIPGTTLLESGSPANYIHYVAVDPVDAPTHASGLPADNTSALYFGWYQSNTSYGEWTKITVSFNTGANTEVALNIGYVCSGSVERADNQPQDITNLYIDNLVVYSRAALNQAAAKAFDSATERGGVAIRIPNAEGTVTQALRFKARIAKDRLEAMALGEDYTVVEYGSLAMNASYIEGDTYVEKANNLVIDYTNAGKNVVKGVTYNADKGTNKVFAYVPGERDLVFTAALTGIGKNMEGDNLAKAYKTDYIVRTYAILRLADGTEVVVYDTVDENDTFSASIYAIAKLAVADASVDETTKTYLQEQIIDICEAAPDEGVASSYSVTYNGAGLVNETAIENFFVDDIITINGDKGDHTNSRPTYYTNDKTIRAYAGNTLTLTAKDGYYISSVVINTLEDYPYGNATTSTGVAETVDNTTTITGINSAEFVLTTPAATRITSITVNYKYGEAPDPVYPETPEDPEEPVDENVTEVTPADLGLANAAAIENVETGSVILNGSQGTHSNSQPAYYSSDNTIRAYEGNTLTVTTAAASAYTLRSVTAAKNIKSIVITFKSGYADDNLGVNIGTKSELVDNVLTISDINAREIVLTFSKTTRILGITVNTEEITPCETHTYTNDCDVECDVCYAVRDDAPHAFVSDCDTTCECGATREALVAHTADACATACELCGEAVVPTHKFAGDCDTTCECGETREATAEHTYVDGACEICGAIEPVSCSHEYDNGCDAECNICFAIREDLTHTFVSDCDTKCEYCDETRETLADHTYEFVCSTECTLCGATREADHVYNDGFCECGKAQPTEVTTTLSIADYATANSWADSTKYTEVKVNEYITATAIGGGNTGKYYTNGNNWRIYQGETGKVTLTAAAGYTIVSVKFTYTNSNSGVFKYNDANAESGSVIAINNTTATFVAGNTGTATNGQVRITDIEVTYDIIPECAEEDHVYADDCATECSVCGKDRVAPHAYVSDCDTTCDCGATREALADHTTDDACETACDLCGEAVVATHKYAGDCDTTCECGATREALGEHTYTDNCDAECDVCGAVRDEVPHVWTDGYDAECDNCGETRIPPLSCEHANADDCDTNCPDCNADLIPTHKYASDCDTTCECGATREALADHVYADDCDADCDNCGATREAPHQYEFACSSTCVCGATRTPADHTYGEDGFCECGEKKPTSTTVEIVAQNCGIANSVDIGTLEIEGVTITGAKGSNANNTPKYYSSGYAFRFYVGNTLTISAPAGYIIDSIVITSVSSYTVKTGMGSAGTETISGTTATFSDINAESWVLTNTNTGSTQVRITNIAVTYKALCTHEYDDDCDANCNLCDEAREVTHADDVLCDTTCSNCGAEVEATADHVYDDENDAICNNCGFERILASECTHEYDNNCDADCNLCDYVREVADHVYDDNCDADCNECGAVREVTHDDDVLCDTTCSNCGAEVEATAEHSYVDGVCSNCGAEEPSEQTLAQFTLGANGTASHSDGSSATTYSETVNGYTLSVTGGTKMYSGARDAQGNSCLKLGTSSAAGGFTFTVAENVTKVIIYVGGYKANTAKLTINGTSYTTTNNSNDGAYDAIEIDTSTTKTVTLTTVSGGYRAMVNGIDFVGTPA